MALWTAFLFGFVGSWHCAGMCGPLALALPATGKTKGSFAIGRVGYNLGRISTYGLLGALFGLVGQTLALVGLQRWLSLGAGAAILLGFAASSRYAVHWPITKAVAWFKSKLAGLLHRRTLPSLFLLGVLNGFLPCGLVYVACAGAVAAGGLVGGVQYMLAFGLGTAPMMLSLGLLAGRMQPVLRTRLQKLAPLCVLALGFLLLLRGLSLGIPYLSPDVSGGEAACPTCQIR